MGERADLAGEHYNRVMTTFPTVAHTVMSADPSDALPTGLTETDAARIAAAISAARADSTRAVYAHAWNQWERWCAARDLSPLPAQPLAVCAYLIDRAESGRSMATLNLACTAIRYVHRHCGAPDPVTETVRDVRQGLRRIHGTAPRRLAHPSTVREVGQVVGGIDRATPIGIRDTAIILLGFASALRRSELVALRLDDITHHPDGLTLTVRQSKTDPHSRGQIVAVAHGQHLRTDPVAALAAWCQTRGHTPGPLFTRLDRTSMSRQPISGHVVESDVDGVVRDYLLVEADRDANVVLHVLPDAQYPYPDSRLRLAADLAEHRGPREEARAAELLHELAIEWKADER